VRALAVVLALAVGGAVLAAATRPDGRVHVIALDVGQGDAILVQTGRGAPAGRRRARPRSSLRGTGRANPAVGPSDRPGDPHPPARGSRGRSPAAPGSLPGRAPLRTGHERPRAGVRGPRDGALIAWSAQRPPFDGRPLRARRGFVPGAVAGSGQRAARSAQHGNRDQQRVDRAARLGRLAALPAHGRHRGGSRSRPGGARAPPRRRSQGGPSREPDRDDGRPAERDRSECGPDLGRGEEHVRAPRAGDPRPAGRPRRRDVPHRPRRNAGRRSRRARAQRPHRPDSAARVAGPVGRRRPCRKTGHRGGAPG
jgi:hypothetical protein